MTRSSAVEIERAAEQLRQERETFDQQKRHDAQWFLLRLIFGYATAVLLLGILSVSALVLFNPQRFDTFVVRAAASALFADALGLVISVYKGVVTARPGDRLAPVTKSRSGAGSGEGAA